MEGKKYDDEKPRLDLIPVCAITGLGEVFGYGAKKYADNNWKSLPNADNRYYGALMRHLMAYRNGEVLDQESKISHLKHVLTNAAILLHFEEERAKAVPELPF